MFNIFLFVKNFVGGCMKKEITTKDLMTFENWMATKMKFCSQSVTEKPLKTMFADMAQKHLENHNKLLAYLKANAGEGGAK